MGFPIIIHLYGTTHNKILIAARLIRLATFQALTEPAIISFQRSSGSKPHSFMRSIMSRIMPDIILDIILGMALVATATTTPPAAAPSSAANTIRRESG